MCSILGRSVSLFALVGLIASGQPLQFEVASIKPVGYSRNGVAGGCHGVDTHYPPNLAASAPPLGRCVITDGRLSHMLAIAFSTSVQRLKGGPDWVEGGERFNLEAKAEDTGHATENQLLEMLQNLLVERFQIKYHTEEIQTNGFALVVAKNGPKFSKSTSDEVAFHMTDTAGNMTKPAPGRLTIINARGLTMDSLAQFLSGFNGPVVDKTGLSGAYDLKTSWDDANGPTLSTALQQDLGLKLESQKVPIKMFVIESAKMPAGN